MSTIQSEQLHGSWVLESFVIRFADGRPDFHPFGKDAMGQLLYTPDGRMSAILARANRPRIRATSLETTAKAPPDDKAAAFDSYLSYAGTWRIEGNEVVHSVEYALSPNLVGKENRRELSFDGDRVLLTYDLSARSGINRSYILTWKRP